MKKTTLILSLLLLSLFADARIVISSCQAPDSVMALYREDACRLALKRITQYNLSYKDSVVIPQDHIDTMMRALLAVHNATSLMARDSVISQYHIHTFYSPNMRYMEIGADKYAAWVQQVNTSQALPSGNIYVDSILAKYHFSFYSYYQSSYGYQVATITVKSDSNYYNIPAFSKMFIGVLPSIAYIKEVPAAGAGSNIFATVFPDHIQLTYSYGWNDCPSGCNFYHNWVFNVYYDCSVEFVGSYGNPLQFTLVPHIAGRQLNVYPIPFSNAISIDGLTGSFTYVIKDLAGRAVSAGTGNNGRINNLDVLTRGIYLLQLEQSGETGAVKIVKD